LIYGPLAREDTSAAKGRGEDGVTDRAHQWSTDPETQKDEERSGPILINQPTSEISLPIHERIYEGYRIFSTGTSIKD
jgi:hypothetical protein